MDLNMYIKRKLRKRNLQAIYLGFFKTTTIAPEITSMFTNLHAVVKQANSGCNLKNANF